jgi:hypothetical protein
MTRFGVKTLTYCACTVGIALLLAVSASAAPVPIVWTTWSSNTDGTLSNLGIDVTYAGELLGLTSEPQWLPISTFSGGVVVNPPPTPSDSIREEGGTNMVDSVTFSKPVVNPVMAIWSLGASDVLARFDFETGSGPFAIQSGGPSLQHLGSSIVVCSNDPSAVCGLDSNGTLVFHGTFSKIEWTQPIHEVFYAMTVGAPVPEPSTLLLLGSAGLGLAGYVRKRFGRGDDDHHIP